MSSPVIVSLVPEQLQRHVYVHSAEGGMYRVLSTRGTMNLELGGKLITAPAEVLLEDCRERDESGEYVTAWVPMDVAIEKLHYVCQGQGGAD